MVYDPNHRWWAHPAHNRKVAQASHDALQNAVIRGRRALRNSRLLELAVKSAGFTFAVFLILWIVLCVSGVFDSVRR